MRQEQAPVAPVVDLSGIGKAIELELEFVVGANGKPGRIISRSPVDRELVRKVIAAVSRWRFEPKLGANGQPVAAKVKLPIQIVLPDHNSSPRYAGKWMKF